MSWNYRVLPYGEGMFAHFAICEVYYDEKGNLAWYTQPVPACGDDLEELAVCLNRMREALTKPILTPEDFRKGR